MSLFLCRSIPISDSWPVYPQVKGGGKLWPPMIRYLRGFIDNANTHIKANYQDKNLDTGASCHISHGTEAHPGNTSSVNEEIPKIYK